MIVFNLTLASRAKFDHFVGFNKMVKDVLSTVLTGFFCLLNCCSKIAPLSVTKYFRQVTSRPIFAPVFGFLAYSLKRRSMWSPNLSIIIIHNVLTFKFSYVIFPHPGHEWHATPSPVSTESGEYVSPKHLQQHSQQQGPYHQWEFQQLLWRQRDRKDRSSPQYMSPFLAYLAHCIYGNR